MLLESLFEEFQWQIHRTENREVFELILLELEFNLADDFFILIVESLE